MTDEKCDSCRFSYARKILGFGGLQCRRYPPVLDAGNSDLEHPRVDPADWCGEYQADT